MRFRKVRLNTIQNEEEILGKRLKESKSFKKIPKSKLDNKFCMTDFMQMRVKLLCRVSLGQFTT